MNLFRWDDYLDKLDKPTSAAGIFEVFQGEIKKLGIDKVMYVTTRREAEILSANFKFLDNFPKEWMERYSLKEYVKHDPLRKHCYKSSDSVIWFERRNVNSWSEDESQVMNEVKEFGMLAGISFPLHMIDYNVPAAVSMCTDGDMKGFNKFVIENSDSLHLASIFFHSIVQSRFEHLISNNGVVPNLSRRQKEVLLWIYAHKRTIEIAKILNISERTVNLHVGLAMKKLNAKTRYEAAAKALGYGLIKP